MYLFTFGSFNDAISVYTIHSSMVSLQNVTSLRDEALTYLWELVAVTSLMIYDHAKPGYYLKLYCSCYYYYYYYYFIRGIYMYVPEITEPGVA